MTQAAQTMPGAVAATLLAAMLLTVPVSFILRWWFSRMVLKDGTTHMPWLDLGDRSPNSGKTQPQLHVGRVTKGDAPELRHVLASLCRGAASDHGSDAPGQQPSYARRS